MDTTKFVQNVKIWCERKGVRPTVACRESGAGERLLENVKRGSEPSIGKVESLAHYFGITVSELIGENSPPRSTFDWDKPLTLHDSAVRLKVEEVEMIFAYRRATPKERKTISLCRGVSL